jgi:hypothetical protein
MNATNIIIYSYKYFFKVLFPFEYQGVTVPIYAHGCTILIGGRSTNQSLDLGMMTNHKLSRSTGQSPELSESAEHNSKPPLQIPILHTNMEPR